MHCGGQLAQSGQGFCPHCGEKVLQTSRAPRWFKWISAIFLGIVGFLIFSFVFTPDLSDTVLEELQALREKRITEAYYNYTSRAFRKAVPLENFREFIEAYPFLVRQTSVKFIERNVEGDSGDLKAVFGLNAGDEAVVHFHLNKEDDFWKISGIALDAKGLSPIAEGNFEKHSDFKPFDASPIYSVIKEQLNKIRQNDLAEAYYFYTAKGFRAATPYSEFEKFIKTHAAFSQNVKINLEQLSFDNNIAEVKAILISKEGKAYPVEYNLAYESEMWKISYVHLMETEAAAEEVNNEQITLQFE
jgi:hypothetical protein